jgi:hypothetical protein
MCRKPKVVLDAPDVPTWEFREKVGRLAAAGTEVLHLFNPRDQVQKTTNHSLAALDTLLVKKPIENRLRCRLRGFSRAWLKRFMASAHPKTQV